MKAYYELPAGLGRDIVQHEKDIERVAAGDLSPIAFKGRRVPRGIYEQRREGTYMVRVRVAGGALTPAQARMLATLCERYGSGRLHVTTRQDVQLHDIVIEDTPEIMRELRTVGLSSKGGGGNTVRNVAACPYAGVCPCERFDVSPWAHKVTEYLIGLPGSFELPRKYKIAFSGCSADCALAAVQDLGFVATVRDGQPGFAVYAGGGMGASSRVAVPLAEFVPPSDAIRVAEAIRRLFDRVGDRQNRRRARLRFAVERLGVEAFRREFAAELEHVRADNVPLAPAEAEITSAAGVEAGSLCHPPRVEVRDGVRFIPQRQPGFLTLPVSLPLGDLTPGAMSLLAEVAERYSAERALRTSQSQDLLIRFIPRSAVDDVVGHLTPLADALPSADILRSFVVCAGADTCRQGLCLSRNLARACADALADSSVGDEVVDAVDVRISGCPNSCGHHPVGTIGLFGNARSVDGRMVPLYRLLLGARRGEGVTRLGEQVAKVPAKAVPALLVRLLQDYESERREGEAFVDYVERLGVASFADIAAEYAAVPPYETAPGFYRDWGCAADFSLAGRGPAECGAGVIDAIREELDAAAKHVADYADGGGEQCLDAARLASCRGLLITRGVDSHRPEEVVEAFRAHFVEAGLVAESMWATSADMLPDADDEDASRDREAAVRSLLERVEYLFSTMDANLNFHPGDTDAGARTASGSACRSTPCGEGCGDAGVDLRGIRCPLTFVHAKLKMEALGPGDVLALVLDAGEAATNVPASFESEGYEVLARVDLGDGSWRVLVRNKADTTRE